MARILKKAVEGISFLQILLDETICEGTVLIPKQLVHDAGGINNKLFAKQKYELLLRIAKETPIVFEETEGAVEDCLMLEDDPQELMLRCGWKTDCYVLGKYSRELQEAGCFDAAVSGVLNEAERSGYAEGAIDWLEQMIGRKEAFCDIDDVTLPILIYKGDSVCHNVLTVFAEQFGRALEQAGVHIIYFDLEKEDVTEILGYRNQRFRAIIGVQSYLFSIKMADEVHYVHEYIYGPKFNFIFDHPIWMKKHLMHQYSDYYILTHDPNYISFAKKYFRKQAILFPPAGMMLDAQDEPERCYDLTFVGTMGDYLSQALWIHELERPKRFLANRFLLIMRKEPALTLEEAFRRAVEHQKLLLTDEEFMEELREICVTGYCVMHYYRYKVIETLLKSGIHMDVFGNSWMNSPLLEYPNLHCHPDVTVKESLEIWRKSKLSLNVMSWHKGGFTERMAGIMMAGAVLVTDDTTYLEGRYSQSDMLIFHLNNLLELPEQVKELLADEKKRERIAENGKKITLREHTWDKRAEQFLELLNNLTGDSGCAGR